MHSRALNFLPFNSQTTLKERELTITLAASYKTMPLTYLFSAAILLMCGSTSQQKFPENRDASLHKTKGLGVWLSTQVFSLRCEKDGVYALGFKLFLQVWILPNNALRLPTPKDCLIICPSLSCQDRLNISRLSDNVPRLSNIAPVWVSQCVLPELIGKLKWWRK